MIVAQITFDDDGSNNIKVSYDQHTGAYIDDDRITISRDMFRNFLILQSTGLFQPKQIQQILHITAKQLQYILCNYDKLTDIFELNINMPDIVLEAEKVTEDVKTAKEGNAS